MDVFAEIDEQIDQITRDVNSVPWPSSSVSESPVDLDRMEAAEHTVTATKKPMTSVKIDVETDKLISDGAHFLGMRKRDFVADAIAMYLENRKEEIRGKMREALLRLDGRQPGSAAITTE